MCGVSTLSVMDDGNDGFGLIARLAVQALSRLVDGPWAVAYREAPMPPGPGLSFSANGAYVAITWHGPGDSHAAAVEAVESIRPLVDALLDAEQRINVAKQEARTDHLTGLLNHRGWDLALAAEEARCERQDRQAVVVVVDLDDLKQFNDLHGHLGGDVLLLLTAHTLAGVCRAEDVSARVGGDEFALLAVDVQPEDEEAVANRVRTALVEAGISASVGASRRQPIGGLRAAYHHADAAMYSDKVRRKAAAALGMPNPGPASRLAAPGSEPANA
jgi:diguanylate cyclase (GGDEF)-like protein